MYKYLRSREYLLELAFVASLTALLHYVALVNFLYWNVDWFDIMMHFLGGATIGLLAMFLFFTSKYFPSISILRQNKTAVFLIIILFTAVIGLGWELWEIFYGFSNIFTDKTDMIIDLVMDMFGALAVFFLEINKNKKV